MTGNNKLLIGTCETQNQPKIRLRTGETSTISHFGLARLANGVVLKKVLHVLAIKHNLLSLQTLTQDGYYTVIFHPGYCIIHDKKTRNINGLGKSMNGLYYLLNDTLERLMQKVKKGGEYDLTVANSFDAGAMNVEAELKVSDAINVRQNVSKTHIWHQRLGLCSLSQN